MVGSVHKHSCKLTFIYFSLYVVPEKKNAEGDAAKCLFTKTALRQQFLIAHWSAECIIRLQFACRLKLSVCFVQVPSFKSP